MNQLKKVHKISVDLNTLDNIIPGSSKIEVLPRKKKKALKKKVSRDLLKFINENAESLVSAMDANRNAK